MSTTEFDDTHDSNEESSTAEEAGVRSDPEIQEILEEADGDRSIQMEFPELDTGTESEGVEALDSVQNPKKSHSLYYGKKEKLLRKILPEGDDHEAARDLIREQVNLYLKEGHETGRDGRQARTSMMEDIVAELKDCVEENAPLFDTYRRLKKMNEEAGHLG